MYNCMKILKILNCTLKMGELCKKDSTLNANSVFTNAMNKNSQVKPLQQENTGVRGWSVSAQRKGKSRSEEIKHRLF